MRARESLHRLKRFEADEMSRKVQGLEQMIYEFEQMASDLERQVQAEEDRTGVKDKSHFAYSTFAKSAASRRDNLLASIGDLRAKLEMAQSELDEVLSQIDVSHDGERSSLGMAAKSVAGIQ